MSTRKDSSRCLTGGGFLVEEGVAEVGDEVGLEELNCLIEPTRFDFQRLLHMAEAKYATRSDVSGLEY